MSSAKGTFVGGAAAGAATALSPDSRVGTVRSLRDETPVAAGHDGTIVEWLVEDGDQISLGQPLLRLHPEGMSA